MKKSEKFFMLIFMHVETKGVEKMNICEIIINIIICLVTGLLTGVITGYLLKKHWDARERIRILRENIFIREHGNKIFFYKEDRENKLYVELFKSGGYFKVCYNLDAFEEKFPKVNIPGDVSGIKKSTLDGIKEDKILVTNKVYKTLKSSLENMTTEVFLEIAAIEGYFPFVLYISLKTGEVTELHSFTTETNKEKKLKDIRKNYEKKYRVLKTLEVKYVDRDGEFYHIISDVSYK